MSTHDHWEMQVKQIRIPEIQIQERVMNRLAGGGAYANQKRLPVWKRKPVMLTAMLLLFLFATGFASITLIQLFHQDGHVLFTVKGYDAHNSKYELAEEDRMKYMNLLQPGEAIAIYNPAGNPDHIVSVLEKPIEMTDYHALSSLVQPAFRLPRELPEHLGYTSGVVYHLLGEPNIEKLIEQSEVNGGEVVWEKVEVKEDIKGVTINLMFQGREYIASLYEGSYWQTMYTDLEQWKDTQVIPIGQSEGVLYKREGRSVLMWMSDQEQGGVFYQILSQGQPGEENVGGEGAGVGGDADVDVDVDVDVGDADADGNSGLNMDANLVAILECLLSDR